MNKFSFVQDLIYCYGRMFRGCTALVNSPELEATEIADSCYALMFDGCTNLVNITKSLPAKITKYNCYYAMFRYCSSITTAPYLPAKVVNEWSYGSMFNGCTSLNHVKCLATDISTTNSVTNWMNNVSQSGAFIKYKDSEWPTGASGIPSGWEVQETEEEPGGLLGGLFGGFNQETHEEPIEEITSFDLEY